MKRVLDRESLPLDLLRRDEAGGHSAAVGKTYRRLVRPVLRLAELLEDEFIGWEWRAGTHRNRRVQKDRRKCPDP